MNKEYKIKVDKKLIKKLQPYWEQAQEIESKCHEALFLLENKMSKDIGIKDLEFFRCDGEMCGIGNGARTMKLIHQHTLEGRDINEEI